MINLQELDWKKSLIYFSVFALMFAISAFISFRMLSDRFTLEMPELVGRTLDEVNIIVEDMALKLTVVDEQYDREVPAGSVLEQSVEPGAMVKGMTEVELVMSKGVEERVVPLLVGLKYDEIKDELQEKEIYIQKVIRVHTSGAQEGEIIAQYPNPDELTGEDITLVVSAGTEDPVYYSPYFLGMSKMDALILARDLGFSVRITELDNSSVISYQSPSPGAEIKRGDVLRLRVGG